MCEEAFLLASMRKTHWKHFVRRDWRISQGQLHHLLGGVQNEKVPGALCKKPGVRGMFLLSFCGLVQPVLFSVCYFLSYSLRCGDTCWVGGVLRGLPGPRPATWCLGHIYSPGAASRPQAPCGGGREVESPSQKGKQEAGDGTVDQLRP